MEYDTTHNPASGQPQRKRRSLARRLLTAIRWIWLAASVMLAIVTAAAAFGGHVNPSVTTLPALLAMAFPAFIIANSVCCIINLFISRRAAALQWLALMASVGAIADWFPGHCTSPHITPENEGDVIRFMSYNTFGFVDDQELYPDSTNRTASAIIGSGADIICLQEVGMIADMPTRSLTVQVDSINDIYPYFTSEEEKMVAILSKYPLREISLEQSPSPYSGWQAAEVYVGSDTILVVSLHLQSIGLNEEDKLIYHRMTDGNMSRQMANAGRVLYNKLSDAFRHRAQQADSLRAQIDSLGYRNVILAGDFNDIEGCYAMRRLQGGNLRSAFREAGKAPTLTYHADRFYFNIDHVLYGGNLEAVRFRRGDIPSSDHYPVYVTFMKH